MSLFGTEETVNSAIRYLGKRIADVELLNLVFSRVLPHLKKRKRTK